jgi:hypothetical protein
MKTTKIEYLQNHQLIELTIKLFEFIELTYGINQADERFTSYFINFISQYYKHLSFEEIESAFERNASGLIDNYLPKIGARPDNKISKFNIPDLTKIINAYCKFVGIEKSEKQQEKKIFTLEEKQEIRKKWCNQLIETFDNYHLRNERDKIGVPIYTCKVLNKFGVLDESLIDYSEDKINVMIKRRSKNENLIFETFDLIIEQGMHIKNFIGNFYYYSEEIEMPY